MRDRWTSAIAVAAVMAFAGSGIAVAADNDAPSAPRGVCPPRAQVLDGVYHPGRLRVFSPCASASGQVVRVKHEVDGDVHLLVNLDASSRHLLGQGNMANAGGDLVVELMPRDSGHLTAPNAGDHLSIVGASTHDGWHDWNEIHPVFALSTNGGAWQTSGPRNGGAPPSASPYAAAAECRTGSGATCRGY